MNKRIGLVVGEFHRAEAEMMLDEASSAAHEYGLEIGETVWVPGSMETPLAAKRLLRSDSIDGVAVLGIIEKGETKHGLVMAQAVTPALINLQLEFMKPIGMGVLGPEIFPSQISPRVRPYARAAVVAVAKMLGLTSNKL